MVHLSALRDYSPFLIYLFATILVLGPLFLFLAGFLGHLGSGHKYPCAVLFPQATREALQKAARPASFHTSCLPLSKVTHSRGFSSMPNAVKRTNSPFDPLKCPSYSDHFSFRFDLSASYSWFIRTRYLPLMQNTPAHTLSQPTI